MSTKKKLRDKGKPHSMSRLESILSKIQNLLADYCEFKGKCPYYDAENYTCDNDGGPHCGKYRKFKAEKN